MKKIDVNNSKSYRIQIDVCNELFNAGYKGLQRSFIKIPKFFVKNNINPNCSIWFPKIIEDKNWKNNLTNDGNTFIQINLKSVDEKNKDYDNNRVTFARYKEGFKFIGVFKPHKHYTNEKGLSVWEFTKISDTCEIVV